MWRELLQSNKPDVRLEANRFENNRADVIEDVTGPSVEDLYWSGYVEIFRLHGHPEAKRCYAWSTYSGEPGDEIHYVAVLELPPVDSPHAAVRAAIMAEMKSAEEEIKKDLPEKT